jgi:hypothetical protein
MRKALVAVAVAALAGSLAVSAPATATTTAARATVIATFGTTESFAESGTTDRAGNVVVSVTHWVDGAGQLYLVRPGGRTTAFGPSIALGGCAMMLGVDLDARGNAIVAIFNFDPSCGADSPASGLLKVTSREVTRLTTMPEGTWPNGVEVVGDTVYVTESLSGAVWTAPTDRVTTQTQPWLTSPLLAPLDDPAIGADGVLFRDGALWLTSYAQGLIVRVPVRHNGSPGTPTVVASDPRLVTADGIAFDSHGTLWVAVNHRTLPDGSLDSGHLVTVTRRGAVSDTTVGAGLLDYPTQVLFGHDGRAFVVNGSYLYGTPNILRIG